MKIIYALFLSCTITAVSCERKLSPAEIKNNLEKSMTDYLQKEQGPDSPPLSFKMVDVTYYEEATYYTCEFTVMLTRPDGTDTTGVIRGRISKDFSIVTKK